MSIPETNWEFLREEAIAALYRYDDDEWKETCWSCGAELDEDTAIPDGQFWLCPKCAALPCEDEEEETQKATA